MTSPESGSLTDWPELERRIRARTSARLLQGRVGGCYRTLTQLDLREAHAAARDAVRTELNMEKQFDEELIRQWGLFEVSTQAQNKDDYLLQPDLGRVFSESSRDKLAKQCPKQTDLQVVIGDGLSVTAVAAQVPKLLPGLCEGANARGWSVGQTFVVRHCRVGILNDIGEILRPTVAVLLIGERPGLATPESLSAYMAYRPRSGQTDADRNLVSNIHPRGIEIPEAADRILNLAGQMMRANCGGVRLAAATARLQE